jgi:hypothetical protein
MPCFSVLTLIKIIFWQSWIRQRCRDPRDKRDERQRFHDRERRRPCAQRPGRGENQGDPRTNGLHTRRHHGTEKVRRTPAGLGGGTPIKGL